MEAAKQVPSQVSTLPDPQFNVSRLASEAQDLSLVIRTATSPILSRCIAGLSLPRKLRLKGEMAKRDADVAQQHYESVRLSVLAGVKAAYFQLAYLSKTLEFLRAMATAPAGGEAADARYRSGWGTNMTVAGTGRANKVTPRITMHHLEVARLEAQIKQLLSRVQFSPDIEPRNS